MKTVSEDSEMSENEVARPLPSMEDCTTTEIDVGISEFLTPETPGFHGILKHRFSDFNVYEINLQDEIVHLTSLDPPKENSEASSGNSSAGKSYAGLSSEEKSLISCLSWSRLTQMWKKYLTENGNADLTKAAEAEIISIDVTSRSKEERKSIHLLIKTHFPNLTSNTKDESEEKKLIIVQYKKTQQENDNKWPRDRPKFLHFTLYKENMDTFLALKILSSNLRLKRQTIRTAGTKDKRGRTVQRACVPWISSDKLKRAANSRRGGGGGYLQVGNFSYEKEAIMMGDLKGNHFNIVLRDIDQPLNVFEPALNSLKNTGFINYYGLQRFGTTNVLTSTVGLACIKSEWSKVVDYILQPRPNEKDPLKAARLIWWNENNPKKALKLLDGNLRFSLEATVLRELVKNDKDLVGAIGALGKNSKTMYPHAYQSLIWNKMTSKRIKEFGLKVIIGDLVQDGELPRKASKEDDENEEDQVNFSTHIKIITPENIDNYTIYDVVLPQPGYDVMLPKNDVKNWYIDCLKSDGLEIENFKNTVKDFDMPGSYRKILVKPTNVKWEIKKYDDPNAPLTLSDIDKVKGLLPIANIENGKYSALILELSLHSSCYATMALREITKQETSKEAQSKLTENFNNKRSAEVSQSPEEPDEKKEKIE